MDRSKYDALAMKIARDMSAGPVIGGIRITQQNEATLIRVRQGIQIEFEAYKDKNGDTVALLLSAGPRRYMVPLIDVTAQFEAAGLTGPIEVNNG